VTPAFREESEVAWIKDINSFYNFIGYVVLCAPDRFPVEDYLAPDQQMNLDKAFAELRKGVDLVDKAVAPDEKRATLLDLLDRSIAAYRSGDDVRGAHLLQDVEALIFKN
jgi:hypothetical protein